MLIHLSAFSLVYLKHASVKRQRKLTLTYSDFATWDIFFFFFKILLESLKIWRVSVFSPNLLLCLKLFFLNKSK